MCMYYVRIDIVSWLSWLWILFVFYHDFQVPVLISRRFPSNGQGTCNFCPSCRRRRDKEKVLILEDGYRAKLTCKVPRFHKRDQNSRDEIKVMEHHLVFCCSFAVTYFVHLPWAQRYASDCFKENMRQAIQRWQGWIKTNGWRLISSANICLYKRTSIQHSTASHAARSLQTFASDGLEPLFTQEKPVICMKLHLNDLSCTWTVASFCMISFALDTMIHVSCFILIQSWIVNLQT